MRVSTSAAQASACSTVLQQKLCAICCASTGRLGHEPHLRLVPCRTRRQRLQSLHHLLRVPRLHPIFAAAAAAAAAAAEGLSSKGLPDLFQPQRFLLHKKHSLHRFCQLSGLRPPRSSPSCVVIGAARALLDHDLLRVTNASSVTTQGLPQPAKCNGQCRKASGARPHQPSRQCEHV